MAKICSLTIACFRIPISFMWLYGHTWKEIIWLYVTDIKICNSFTLDNIIFFNCILILFHWWTSNTTLRYCHVSQQTVHFKINKYTSRDGDVEFFMNLTKIKVIKVFHQSYLWSSVVYSANFQIIIWLFNVLMHEILPWEMVIYNWKK